MKPSAGKQLAFILAVALGLRLAAGAAWQARLEGRFGFGDSASYWTLAQALSAGKPYQYGEVRVFRTPGYPLLLAPIFLLAGEDASVIWARAQSALLGTLAVGGVWWLGAQLFDQRAGLVAASMAAVYPGSVAISALVLSEAPFCPLMVAHLILWIAAWNAPSVRRTALLAFSGGLVAGAAALVRPSWLLFAPFAIVVGLAAGKARKRHLALGAAMLIGLMLAMMPWWIRNARVIGHFVPTTLQVGVSLYDGLNPQASGASNIGAADGIAAEEYRRPPASAEGTREPFEYRLDRRLRAEALAWARAHPGRVLELAGVKLARMWNFWPNERVFSAWYIRLAVVVTYVPVLLLGAVGAWKTIHRGFPYVLCWLPAVYFTLLHVVFVSSIRYREPAMLPWMVLGAGVIVSQLGAEKNRR